KDTCHFFLPLLRITQPGAGSSGGVEFIYCSAGCFGLRWLVVLSTFLRFCAWDSSLSSAFQCRNSQVLLIVIHNENIRALRDEMHGPCAHSCLHISELTVQVSCLEKEDVGDTVRGLQLKD